MGDFWRMVWEQRTATVVMMTRLEEKSRVRRGRALPGGGVGKSHQLTQAPFVSLWDEVPQGNSLVLLFSWSIAVVPRHEWVPRMLICRTRCSIFWECVCVFPGCWHVPGMFTCSPDAGCSWGINTSPS